MNNQHDWGTWRHVVELIHRVLTVSGMMVLATMATTIRVLTHGPEWAAWPAIITWAMAVYNDTGRWLIPQVVEKFLTAKYGNGAPKPP